MPKLKIFHAYSIKKLLQAKRDSLSGWISIAVLVASPRDRCGENEAKL
jgi:hypothetical protein